MKELLDKLSSYNLFNYLLPGTVFVALAQRISDHTFRNDSIVVELFAFYFIGLVISRIGSLIVEPILKRVKFVKFADYRDFVHACEKDPKIEILSEQNNMLRTLAATFVALFGLRVFDLTVSRLGVPKAWSAVVVFVALLVMFAFAYRKQTSYVKKRVEAAMKR
jgi:hypothetical protein